MECIPAHRGTVTNGCFLADSKSSQLSPLRRGRPKAPRIFDIDVYCRRQSYPCTRISHLAPALGSSGMVQAWSLMSEIGDSTVVSLTDPVAKVFTTS